MSHKHWIEALIPFFGSTTQDGIVPTTGMDRYNVKLTAESRLEEHWTTGFPETS